MADTDETARTSTDRARRVLRAQLVALTDRMHTESDVLNVRVAAGDFIDAAQGMEQQELARLTASRLAQRARRVESALSRVSDGQYGICSECGGVIPPEAARRRSRRDDLRGVSRSFGASDSWAALGHTDRVDPLGSTHLRSNRQAR
jgi:RNA polymerase-binding transcription factor DksA